MAIGASSPNVGANRDTGFKRRVRRILAVCLVASATLHAAVLVLFPAFEIDRGAPNVRVLDVQLLSAYPPAIAPVTPEPSVAENPRGAQSTGSRVAIRGSRAPAASASAAIPAAAEAMAQISIDLTKPPADLPVEGNGNQAEPAPVASVFRSDAPPALKAAYLHNPPPAYPPIARRNGEQGTVTLRVLVARDGAPASVSVERSSGYAHLDRSALEAVRAWRFAPAHEQGEPVEVWMLVPIAFRLEGAS